MLRSIETRTASNGRTESCPRTVAFVPSLPVAMSDLGIENGTAWHKQYPDPVDST